MTESPVRLARQVEGVLAEAVSPAPLAVYRIAFTFVVLAEYLHFLVRRDLYLLAHPLTDAIPAQVWTAIVIWGVGIIGTLVGFLTPLSALVMYRGIVAFFPPSGLFSYHADMLYVPASLLLVVLPCWRTLSVDRALVRRAVGVDLAANPIPRLFYCVTPFYVMGFMYADSTLYKLHSQFWLDGLGFWLPTSFPSFTTFSWNAMLNQRWLVLLAGYVTLAFEFVFIFVFWMPEARLYLLLIGLVLHTGIAVAFPIPLFGLLMVAMYLNFVPDRRLAEVVRWPALNPPAPRIAHDGLWRFDRAAMRALMVAMALAAVVQAGVTFNAIQSPRTRAWLEQQVGITRHLVFGEWQFSVMSRTVALVYCDERGAETWLSWVKRDGHVGWLGYGRPWSFWWIQSLRGDPAMWARAAEAWAKTNGVDLTHGSVIVRTQDIRSPQHWERDRQRQLEQQPWRDELMITWPHGRPTFHPLNGGEDARGAPQ